MVEVERAENGTARLQRAEVGEFLFGQRRTHALADVQASQRSDAVQAGGVAEWLVVGRFQVAVRLYGFADGVWVVVCFKPVDDDPAPPYFSSLMYCVPSRRFLGSTTPPVRTKFDVKRVRLPAILAFSA